MKTRTRFLLTALACCGFSAAADADVVIVAENFGGLGTDDLHNTTADTFASGITTAGGSSTWQAEDDFNADGSMDATGDNGTAYLNLGSYINDSKGTADAFFTASVTISGPASGGNWVGFGFFENNTPDVGGDFVTGGSNQGQGILIYRSTGELDGFGGTGSGGAVDGDIVSGSQSLKFELDLTDWNGTDNFGSITFYDGTGTSFGTHEYTSTETWGSIGLTASPGATATFSNFQLTQVPEPGSLALLGLGSLLIGARRRRG